MCLPSPGLDNGIASMLSFWFDNCIELWLWKIISHFFGNTHGSFGGQGSILSADRSSIVQEKHVLLYINDICINT